MDLLVQKAGLTAGGWLDAFTFDPTCAEKYGGKVADLEQAGLPKADALTVCALSQPPNDFTRISVLEARIIKLENTLNNVAGGRVPLRFRLKPTIRLKLDTELAQKKADLAALQTKPNPIVSVKESWDGNPFNITWPATHKGDYFKAGFTKEALGCGPDYQENGRGWFGWLNGTQTFDFES